MRLQHKANCREEKCMQRCPDCAALRHFRFKIINAALTVDTCAHKTHHLYLNKLICLTLLPQHTPQLVINMLHNLHFALCMFMSNIPQERMRYFITVEIILVFS